MKKLILSLLISISFNVFGQDITGTGWFFYEDDGDETIILFESDKTFTYLNVVQASGNEGTVFNDDRDTWTIDGKIVVISFTDGYKISSLTINNIGDSMSGTSINKVGKVNIVTGKLIK